MLGKRREAWRSSTAYSRLSCIAIQVYSIVAHSASYQPLATLLKIILRHARALSGVQSVSHRGITCCIFFRGASSLYEADLFFSYDLFSKRF